MLIFYGIRPEAGLDLIRLAPKDLRRTCGSFAKKHKGPKARCISVSHPDQPMLGEGVLPFSRPIKDKRQAKISVIQKP